MRIRFSTVEDMDNAYEVMDKGNYVVQIHSRDTMEYFRQIMAKAEGESNVQKSF